MKVFVEGGQLFDGEETPAEEEIGKLEKVRQEGDIYWPGELMNP